jgi:hypothetical protein
VAELRLLLVFVVLAAVHTWPMPSDPAHLTRLDNNDTAFNTWVITWVAHQLTNAPLQLFEAPIFYPAKRALAFSEHMAVQGAMTVPLQWVGASPVLTYNLLVWLGLALSGFAMACLVRTWTGSVLGGIVAGCLYSFNAYTLTSYAHLQALHLEFLPLVLYAFDRVLRDARTAHVLLLIGSFVLQALCSNYTMVMMSAALLVALAVRPEPRRFDRRLWLSLAAAAIAAAILLLPFLLPYYYVRAEEGLVRTIDDVRIYSATWRDYLATGGRLHHALWSHRVFDGRTPLFPGITALALAALAVVSGVGWRDARARMALAFGSLGVVLSFGALLPGYEWLHTHVTLLQGIRAVARWGVLFLIAVAILAGYAVAALESRWQTRPWWRVAAIGLIALVTVEAIRAPLTMYRFEGVPDVYARLAREDIHAMAIFPLFGGRQFDGNAPYLIQQTRHWRPMLNGYSSFAPPRFYSSAETLQAFPAPVAIDVLRKQGISHVLLQREPLERDYGAAALDSLRTHADLEFVFEQDGVILYRVR